MDGKIKAVLRLLACAASKFLLTKQGSAEGEDKGSVHDAVEGLQWHMWLEKNVTGPAIEGGGSRSRPPTLKKNHLQYMALDEDGASELRQDLEAIQCADEAIERILDHRQDVVRSMVRYVGENTYQPIIYNMQQIIKRCVC